MTENLERHQEKLEEKQAACLEQIRELEKQVTGTVTLAPNGVGPAPGCKGARLQGASSQEFRRRGLTPHQWVRGFCSIGA